MTTFDALRGFPAPGCGEVGLLVVDEAHSVKNPKAKRSQSVALWTERCERALFMTGTPRENRVVEFRNLVQMLDGEVKTACSCSNGGSLTSSKTSGTSAVRVRVRGRPVAVLRKTLVRTSYVSTDAWGRRPVRPHRLPGLPCPAQDEWTTPARGARTPDQQTHPPRPPPHSPDPKGVAPAPGPQNTRLRPRPARP